MIAVVAIAAISAVAQWYQSEQARKANQSQLNKIKDLYSSLIPPNYDLTIDDPPKLHKNTLSLPQYAEALESPDFALTHLTPQNLRRVGLLVPEFTQYVQERAPELLTESADMQKGRAAQLRALDRYKEIGAGEFDPEYQGMVTKAARAAQQEAASANASILQSAARRGMQNSGLTMAMQGQAGSQAMDRLASANLDAATQAYQNRLQALASGAQLGGEIRGQDLDMKNRNADIINSFNQRMQSGQQAVENSRAQAINRAREYNLGEDQRIADENVIASNQNERDERSRLDDITRFNYGARQAQQSRGDNIAQRSYQDQLAKLDYNNNIAQTLANWNAQQRLNQNNLKARQFQDSVTMAGGQAVPVQMQMDMNTQKAQDTNQMIQGVSNIGYQWGQQEMDREWQNDQRDYENRITSERRAEDRDFAKRLADYKRNGDSSIFDD